MNQNLKKSLFIGTALLAVTAGLARTVSAQTLHPSTATSTPLPASTTGISSLSTQAQQPGGLDTDTEQADDQNGTEAPEAGEKPGSEQTEAGEAKEAPDAQEAQEAKGGPDTDNGQDGDQNGPGTTGNSSR